MRSDGSNPRRVVNADARITRAWRGLGVQVATLFGNELQDWNAGTVGCLAQGHHAAADQRHGRKRPPDAPPTLHGHDQTTQTQVV